MKKLLLTSLAVLAISFSSVNTANAEEYPSNLGVCFMTTMAIGFAISFKLDLDEPSIIGIKTVEKVIDNIDKKYDINILTYQDKLGITDLSDVEDMSGVNELYVKNTCKDFE